MPLGNPTALNVIALSNPSATTVLMVVVPLVPAWTVKVSTLLNAWSFRSTTANPGTGAGAEGAYCQRSLSYTVDAKGVSPPKSQRLPLRSDQLEAPYRQPGPFPGAGVPFVPYTDGGNFDWSPLLPIHAHSLAEGLNPQRSSVALTLILFATSEPPPP